MLRVRTDATITSDRTVVRENVDLLLILIYLSAHVFLHTLSGCDTISTCWRKQKFLRVLQKNCDLQPVINAFKDLHVHQDQVIEEKNLVFISL